MSHFNGPKLKVPARDLVPAKTVHANPSKYNICKALADDREMLLRMIPGGHDLQWLDEHRKEPYPNDWLGDDWSDDEEAYAPQLQRKRRENICKFLQMMKMIKKIKNQTSLFHKMMMIL